MNHDGCLGNITELYRGKLVTGCEICLASLTVQGTDMAAKNRRDTMRRDHKRDLIQPNDPRNFAKAYPDKAREIYSDEQMRRYG